ncbi:MAG: hypothetical protein ACT4QG_13510 [Sporichthyaceae bacterium]
MVTVRVLDGPPLDALWPNAGEAHRHRSGLWGPGAPDPTASAA